MEVANYCEEKMVIHLNECMYVHVCMYECMYVCMYV